jgi:hypothetical protein
MTKAPMKKKMQDHSNTLSFGHWSLGFDLGIRVSEFGFSSLVASAIRVIRGQSFY